jgi:cyanophycinase
MATKGKLIAIGGGEDKERNRDVLKRFLEEIGKKDPVIEIITTATSLPDEVGDDYTSAFRSLGVRDYNTLHIDEKDQASDRKFIERIEKADGVLFSGGDQLKLSSILGGTDFHKMLKDRYENDDFVIAGTSAGAAAMSQTMIVRGSSEDALIKGELKLTTGLGFIDEVFIDTHFTQRGRFGRLIQAVSTIPSSLGLGLGEDTAAVITGGNHIEIVGSGLVVIVDGQHIRQTTITEIKDGEPLTVEGVMMHVLCKGDRFLLQERTFAKRGDSEESAPSAAGN